MNAISRQLTELKFALQELESAVQQPRDERFAIEQVLDRFPPVVDLLFQVLSAAHLQQDGQSFDSPELTFAAAHRKNWLKGDIVLWMRLLSDFQELKSVGPDHGSKAIAQDIRASSSMLWETYEAVTARFRWQTQVRPVPAAIAALPKPNYAPPMAITA